jgi:ATP-dependent helicase/nuclease subunit B
LKPVIPLEKPEPLAAQVAAHLLAGRTEKPIDLGDTLVLIPTAGASRAIRRELSKKGVLSPQFRLPMDALVPSGIPVASRLEREATWATLLNPDDRERFKSLVPLIVPLDSPDDRFGVAERLCGVCDQLAEAGLDPTSPQLASELSEDKLRWADFGKLYIEYLAVLSKHSLRDPNDVRIEQVRSPSVPAELKRVIVTCIPDLAPVLETYLQSLENKGINVEVLACSPADQAKHLDAMGRPDIEWWRSHMPELKDDMIVVENDPASEAGVLIDHAAEGASDGGYALFSAAPEATVALGAEIARRKEEAYLPEGRALAQTEFAGMLIGYEELLQSQSLQTLRSLLQRPTFLAWFVAQAADKNFTGDGALDACDRLIADKLCRTVESARSWLDHADQPAVEDRDRAKFDELARLILTAEKILQRKQPTVDFLAAVAGYAGRMTSGSMKAKELSAMAEALDQFSQSPLLRGLPASDQKAALRADLGRKRLFAPAPNNAVEIQGWLEAPWSAAALKIIAGCREGALPSGTHEDAFLPDQAKKKLGLVCQDARFARDAYLLSCLIHSGSRVLLGTSRFRSQGEPNRPSRLLFACGDEELPRRSRRLLRPSLPAKRQETKASWNLELPAREKAVESIRVTGFKNYLQCPLRFYLQNVCGIRDFDPEAREISPRDFGTVMHKVLEEYGGNEATKDLEDPAEIARVFDRKLDEVARRFYGDLFSPVVLVQLESMRARLRSFAPLQAQARADGWEFIATEKSLGKRDKKPGKIGPLILTGTIDRVEVNRREGRVRVLDYKTFGSATTPAKTHLATKRDRPDVPTAACTYAGKPAFWKDLQLPLYRYLVPHIWEEHKDKEIEVGYVLLPADPDDTGIEMLPMDEDEFGSAVQCAEEIASLVSKGIFWPPSEKVDFDNFADWFRYCDPKEIVSEQTRKRLGGAA